MTPKRVQTPVRRMRGQALTELAIAAAFVVPLFLLIPILAKYGHARQMAQQAARNVAWEATVSPQHNLAARTEVQARVIDRNFASADAAIRSAPSGQATGAFGDQMLNTFSGRKLLEKSDVRVTRWNEARAPGFVSGLLARFPDVLPGAFPPNDKGYVTAEVEFKLRNLTARNGERAGYLDPFDTLDIVMTERHTLLADGWNASGPTAGRRSVKSQVKSFVPTSSLAALEDVFNVVGALPIPMLGKLDDLDPGVIEPDIVPTDRLRRYPVNDP